MVAFFVSFYAFVLSCELLSDPAILLLFTLSSFSHTHSAVLSSPLLQSSNDLKDCILIIIDMSYLSFKCIHTHFTLSSQPVNVFIRMLLFIEYVCHWRPWGESLFPCSLPLPSTLHPPPQSHPHTHALHPPPSARAPGLMGVQPFHYPDQPRITCWMMFALI